ERADVGLALMDPGEVVGQVHAPAAQLEHRHDVRAQRIAHHHELAGGDRELLQQAPVGGDVLLAHDLDAAEEGGHARVAHLGFLVEQVALGDEHHRHLGGHGLDRLAHAREQFHRVPQQVLGQGHDAVHVGAADAAAGDVDGGFDHRQRHAFHAVAEHRQVGLLHRVQALAGAGVAVDVARGDRLEVPLGLVEIVLAAPEGVVGVEADHADRGHRPIIRETPRRRGAAADEAGRAVARRSAYWPPWSLAAWARYSSAVSSPSPSASAWSNTAASAGSAADSAREMVPLPSASTSFQPSWRPAGCASVAGGAAWASCASWAAAASVAAFCASRTSGVTALCASATGMASAVPRARMAARCVRAWFIGGISLRARGRPVHGWSDRTGIPAARTPCRAAHESRLRPGGGVDMALTTRAGAGARGAQGPGLPDTAGPDCTRRPAMKPHALTLAALAAALATACNGDARPAQAAAAPAQADAPARAEAPARPFEVDMIASFAEPWRSEEHTSEL